MMTAYFGSGWLFDLKSWLLRLLDFVINDSTQPTNKDFSYRPEETIICSDLRFIVRLN